MDWLSVFGIARSALIVINMEGLPCCLTVRMELLQLPVITSYCQRAVGNRLNPHKLSQGRDGLPLEPWTRLCSRTVSVSKEPSSPNRCTSTWHTNDSFLGLGWCWCCACAFCSYMEIHVGFWKWVPLINWPHVTSEKWLTIIAGVIVYSKEEAGILLQGKAYLPSAVRFQVHLYNKYLIDDKNQGPSSFTVHHSIQYTKFCSIRK